VTGNAFLRRAYGERFGSLTVICVLSGGNFIRRDGFSRGTNWETDMPIILWLLGVPLGLVVVLWLLHVI
jgi:hypothetical protein